MFIIAVAKVTHFENDVLIIFFYILKCHTRYVSVIHFYIRLFVLQLISQYSVLNLKLSQIRHNVPLILTCSHGHLWSLCAPLHRCILKSVLIWSIVRYLLPDSIVMKHGCTLTSYSRIKKHFLLIRDKAIWMEFDYINFN